MAKEQKTLGDYYMDELLDAIQGSIVIPTVDADNFEINPALISIIQTSIQFGGLPSEDPGSHLRKFLQTCDTIKYNGVSEDAIRLRLFPFSLKDKADWWLRSLPARSITTWKQLVTQFLAKYFPSSRWAKLMRDISAFAQLESESLYEAWERFHDLLGRCPHHRLPNWQLAHIFFEGLTPANQSMLDVVGGGFLRRNKPEQAYDWIDQMVSNSYQWQPDRHVMEKQEKQPGVLAMDTNIAILKQLEVLTKKVESLMVVQNQPLQSPTQ